MCSSDVLKHRSLVRTEKTKDNAHQHSGSQLSSLKSIKVPHGKHIHKIWNSISTGPETLFIIQNFFSIQFYAFVIETLFEFHLFVESLVDISRESFSIARKCHVIILPSACMLSFRTQGGGEHFGWAHKSYRKIIHLIRFWAAKRRSKGEEPVERKRKRSQMSRWFHLSGQKKLLMSTLFAMTVLGLKGLKITLMDHSKATYCLQSVQDLMRLSSALTYLYNEGFALMLNILHHKALSLFFLSLCSDAR